MKREEEKTSRFHLSVNVNAMLHNAWFGLHLCSLKLSWPRGTYHCNRPFITTVAPHFLRVYFVSPDLLHFIIPGYNRV